MIGTHAESVPPRAIGRSSSTACASSATSTTGARSAAFPERARALARLRLFAGTGFAGAFTTYGGYAAWTVSSAAQWSTRAHGAALALAQSAGLLAVGAAAAWAGHRLVSGAQR